MSPLFAHHTEGYFEVEIMGRPFPTGPQEHALAFGGTALALVLMGYGLYAIVRDVWRWRRGRMVARVPR
jgi:hypothetical protein